ncbi:hypothetical protein VTK56DRAFT_4695 [Thermocarpiscus australiensis]
MGLDADDTAKALLSLSLLNQPVDPGPLIEAFEAESYFRTYPSERDPSLSANCNALLALLHQPDPSRHSSQIKKLVKFICHCWWVTDGEIKDKWNICPLYSSMLLVEAFTDLLCLMDSGTISGLLDSNLKSRVSITIFQAGLCAMLLQEHNGSWKGSIEQTLYGILILSEARRICFFKDIQEHLKSAVDRGVEFLKCTARIHPTTSGLRKSRILPLS